MHDRLILLNKVFLPKLVLHFHLLCLLLFGLSSSFDYFRSDLRAFAVLSMLFDVLLRGGVGALWAFVFGFVLVFRFLAYFLWSLFLEIVPCGNNFQLILATWDLLILSNLLSRLIIWGCLLLALLNRLLFFDGQLLLAAFQEWSTCIVKYDWNYKPQ